MAGHSQFKNIMHRKGAQDKKRAKVFARLVREIAVASRFGGTDPNSNSRLRFAIQEARGQNMPKDTIERAIRKAEGGTAEDYAEVTYEGYGPGGVGFVVEALTDNRNRTAASVRTRFGKCGGSLAEGGAVIFQFEQVGEITFDRDVADEEVILEAAIESDAIDAISEDHGHRVVCSRKDLTGVADKLEILLGAAPSSTRLVWSPRHTVKVAEEKAAEVLRLFELLNDDDDVQEVFANFDLPEELIERLAA